MNKDQTRKFIHKHKKQLFSAGALLLWILTIFAFTCVAADNISAAQEQGYQQVEKAQMGLSLSERITDQEEQPFYSAVPDSSSHKVRISILLEMDAALETGYDSEGLAENERAQRYRERCLMRQQQIIAAIETRVLNGGELEVIWNLTLAENMICAAVEQEYIPAIGEIKGVEQVLIDPVYEIVEPSAADILMTDNLGHIGADAVAREYGYTGAGMRIAIIDTGIDTDHEIFNEEAFTYSLSKLAEAAGEEEAQYITDLDLMTADDIDAVASRLNVRTAADEILTGDDAYLSSKLPFAFDYANRDYDADHGTDTADHGTSVASCAAANAYVRESGDTYAGSLAAVGTQGVAPDAQIIVMKVFSGAGAYAGDYMAAIEDALLLECDVINLSLGTRIAGNAQGEEAYKDILSNIDEYGAVVTMAVGNSSAWSFSAPNLLLYTEDVNMSTLGAPASMTDSFSVAAVDTSTGGTDAAGESTFGIASFSSWGITGALELKPEISAPGRGIYAAAADDTYSSVSGTSFAAPVTAGSAALLLQHIQEEELENKFSIGRRVLAQSLLMSTATPLQYEAEIGGYYSLLQQGAGMVNVEAALKADCFILMDEDATASAADGKVKAELGDDSERKGIYTFSFTVYNTSARLKTISLDADLFVQDVYSDGENEYMAVNCLPVDNTVEWSVSDPSAVSIAANSSQKITVTIKLSDKAKSSLEEDYPNGTYMQGFVFVQEAGEGDQPGVTHSIPVLGFYGSWGDAPMFDHSEYTTMLTPALEGGKQAYTGEIAIYQGYRYFIGNGLILYREGMGTSWFTGNPVVVDDTYMPQRNAINPNTTALMDMQLSLIRNAIDSRVTVKNLTSGQILQEQKGGPLYAKAYYNDQWWTLGGSGIDTLANNFSLRQVITDAAEGDQIQVQAAAALEYYQDKEGKIDWAALPKGAFYSITMTVDTMAPQLVDISRSEDSQTLYVEAWDNRYLAAVALSDNDGYDLVDILGSLAEAEANTAYVYQLDASGLDMEAGAVYLELCDYAFNIASYQLMDIEALPVYQPPADTDEETTVKRPKRNNKEQPGITEPEPEPIPLPFVDVVEGDHYYESIAYVYAAGIMNGTSAELFSPGEELTRAMLVTVIYRAANEPAVSYRSVFEDVAADTWYTDAVAWAAENKIVNGYGNGLFGPQDEVTNEQMAAILYRYFMAFGESELPQSNDNAVLEGYYDSGKISAYAVPAMEWVLSGGIMEAKDGYLQPREAALRRQVAYALHHLLIL